MKQDWAPSAHHQGCSIARTPLRRSPAAEAPASPTRAIVTKRSEYGGQEILAYAHSSYGLRAQLLWGRLAAQALRSQASAPSPATPSRRGSQTLRSARRLGQG